jgi:hypothetical protein
MANEDTGALGLTLNAVTDGSEPRRPNEINCPLICPHSWYVLPAGSLARS